MAKKSSEKEAVKSILTYLQFHPAVAKAWQNDSVPIVSVIKREKGYVIGRFRKRQTQFRPNGVSDILGFLRDGRMLALEIKSSTGKLSPDQKSFLDDCIAHGCVAGVARSIEDVDQIFKQNGFVRVAR